MCYMCGVGNLTTSMSVKRIVLRFNQVFAISYWFGLRGLFTITDSSNKKTRPKLVVLTYLVTDRCERTPESGW